MVYSNENLYIMIPYSERRKVEGYFDLSLEGEEYASLIGGLTDMLASKTFQETDEGLGSIIVPILRAGKSMSNRMEKRLPLANTYQISMRRNMETLRPFVDWDEFCEIDMKLTKNVIIVDPALATGGSILETIKRLHEVGFKDENILIMSMFSSEVGLENIFSKYNNIKIHTVHLADGMRSDGYLIPDNGDTGDRLYGVRES